MTNTNDTITLTPPAPPAKPDRLLWIDVETTGISRTDSKLLEVGMIVTGMDGVEAHDQFTSIVRPSECSLFDVSPAALRMHLANGLWDQIAGDEHEAVGYPIIALNLKEWLQDEASRYTLHPAGTNVDYDIDILDHQLGEYNGPDWIRSYVSHRKLDLSAFRMADIALGHNPYRDHAGTHRVQDCISRDRSDYAMYLDIMCAGQQGDHE
ncbi:ribonuclease [Bifidobacterium amazonense]|uniref:Ribonuclease n=1 Tax=Bifidobacterium amazonense TaxID=2809027 RepID=A0ABS9VSB8_9BIFI|nr:ribonuclease [Bifidobacterium amazonense]MCH9274981.1 ribonuclease [Bifidobacterium amazonense]